MYINTKNKKERKIFLNNCNAVLQNRNNNNDVSKTEVQQNEFSLYIIDNDVTIIMIRRVRILLIQEKISL